MLVDLAGDVPAALGVAEPDGPGLAGWLAAGADVPADALGRLEEPAAPGLRAPARGAGPLDAGPGRRARRRCSPPTPGRSWSTAAPAPHGVALAVAAGATRSLLVTRPCFLALRRALGAPLRPSEIVLLTEPGRSLGAADVEECLGAPVVAEVAVDPPSPAPSTPACWPPACPARSPGSSARAA